MNAVATRDDLLGTLRANEAANSARLRASGHLGETPSIRCSRCGLYEALVFWTSVERRSSRSSGKYRFQCPSGCDTFVNYDPNEDLTRKHARRKGPSLANWVLVPIVLYALFGYPETSSPGRSFVARIWTTSQAQLSELGLALPGLAGSGATASAVVSPVAAQKN